MALTLTFEQQLLRDNAREYVQHTTPVNHLRRIRDQQVREGFSREVWAQMAEFGWIASHIPEAYGGMGLGYTELAIVLEECGRTLVPTPFVSSALLGAGVVLQGGDEEHKRALLPAVASGKHLLSLAFEETPRSAASSTNKLMPARSPVAPEVRADTISLSATCPSSTNVF